MQRQTIRHYAGIETEIHKDQQTDTYPQRKRERERQRGERERERERERESAAHNSI